MRLRRTTRLLVSLAAVPVVAFLTGMVTLAGPAASQEAEPPAPTSDGVGGFDLRSQSSALLVNVDTPNLALPRLAQVGIPYATTNAVSGPSGLAIGSVLWPGPIGADPNGVLAQVGVPLVAPGYPIRAQAAVPSDQQSQVVEPGPGVRMAAEATSEALHADAKYPSFEAPGFLRVGSLAASSDTTLEEGVVTTTTRAHASGVDLLGGLIRIGALTSEATAASNGREGRAQGSVSPVEVTVGDQEAALGTDGITIPGNEAATDALNQFLDQVGMEIRLLPDDVRTDDQGTATADVSGLFVRFAPSDAGEGAAGSFQRELTALLATLFGPLSLPPELGNQLNLVTSLLAADYRISFILGSSSASVLASPGFGGFDPDAGGFDPGAGGLDTSFDPGTGGFDTSFDPGTGGFDTSFEPGTGGLAGGGPGPSTGAGDRFAALPIDTSSLVGTAVPVGAVVAAFLAAPAFAGLARRFGMFALAPPTAVCPLEEPPKEPR